MADATKQAAFSLTGPFGTGKSAFILQVLHLLGCAGRANTTKAHCRLETANKQASSSIRSSLQGKKKPLTVLITGRQAPVKATILTGILNALKEEKIRAPKTKKLLKRTIDDAATASISEIIQLLDAEIGKSRCGIYVVIDEFGKLLEYAALHPSQSDIYILQEMAELRKDSKCGQFMLITVLHQAFEGYAKYLSLQSQNEWAKIQGRFVPLNIAERPAELIPLIVKGIKRKTNRKASEMFGRIDAHAKKRAKLIEASSLSALAMSSDLKRYVKEGYHKLLIWRVLRLYHLSPI